MSYSPYTVIAAHEELHQLIGEFADRRRVGICINYLQEIQKYCADKIELEERRIGIEKSSTYHEVKAAISKTEAA